MKLSELYDLLAKINTTVDEINEKYSKKISDIQKKMDDLKNMQGKSKQYVEDQQKKLEKQLNEIIDQQTKKIKEFADSTNKSINDKITLVGVNAAQNIASKFGVPAEIMDAAVDAIKKTLKDKIK